MFGDTNNKCFFNFYYLNRSIARNVDSTYLGYKSPAHTSTYSRKL